MKKIILVILIITGYIHAWETTTHRAIDKTAIESRNVGNLIKFIDASGIAGEDYAGGIFEGYGVTYFNTRKI